MLIAVNRNTGQIVRSDCVDVVGGVEGECGCGNGFACVVCGDSMSVERSCHGVQFRHSDGSKDCTASEATCRHHRAAVELAVHELSTVLADPEIRFEYTVSGSDGAVTCDAVSIGRVPVVVEVFHNCSYMQIRRRLERVFDAGYGSVFILMTESGRYSAERVDYHLSNVVTGGVWVGRVSVADRSVSLGSRLTPAVVDLRGFDDPGMVPEYVR